MKRRITTLLLSLGLIGAGLVAAVPAAASASTTSGVGIASAAPGNCEFRQRFTFEPNTVFSAGDCYETPGSFLLMQDDGNFVLRYPDGTVRWATNTEGYPGAIVIFQGGNLIVWHEGHPLKSIPAHFTPDAHLILRGGDGSLLIRDASGQLIWIV